MLLPGKKEHFGPPLLLAGSTICGGLLAYRMLSPPTILPAPSRLVLTGFMGSGKTTVGKVLARLQGWDFLDLDDHVAAREHCSVPELITERGEPAFRAAEVSALQDLLTSRNQVIALGGGTPESPAVHTLLQSSPDTLVIYLQAPFGELYGRCLLQADDPTATKRPLFTDRESTAQRFHRRVTLYESLAHLTVDTCDARPEALARAIWLRLQQN